MPENKEGKATRSNKKSDRAQRKIEQQITVDRGINRILNSALTAKTEEALGNVCLTVAEQMSGSKFGFIGYVNEQGLEDIAISNPDWEACKIIDQRGHRRPPRNFVIHGIYGRVLTDGKAFFTNNPAKHPDSIGTPEGHPPLESFLGVPLKQNKKTIGLLAVANREGGYTNVELNVLEALAPAIVEVFIRRRAEKRLEEYSKNLEKIVEERTQKIREGEQNYRDLYESFGEAFIATDWELTVIHWNKAAERITRISGKDALGKKVYDVLPEMMTIDVTPYYETLQQKKPVRFMMNTFSRETKRPSVFEVSMYPSVQGMICIVEDKTEEEETKRLSAIGQTAGMVGHDIRNPLQTITSDVFLAKSDLALMPESKEKDSIKESLGSIEKNIDYINKIVQDLQDYARPIAIITKDTELEKIFGDVLAKAAIPERLEVSHKVEADAKKLIADPDLLKRILANLVNNAVQAMPKGGKLTLNASRERGDVVITVEDTGEGIPIEVRPKLFTPLFTTKSRGQGFGLAVVKRMTEAMRGTVAFESEIGKGTKFTLRFPDRR
jgi:PAS domain S-box-containing protein